MFFLVCSQYSFIVLRNCKVIVVLQDNDQQHYQFLSSKWGTRVSENSGVFLRSTLGSCFSKYADVHSRLFDLSAQILRNKLISLYSWLPRGKGFGNNVCLCVSSTSVWIYPEGVQGLMPRWYHPLLCANLLFVLQLTIHLYKPFQVLLGIHFSITCEQALNLLPLLCSQ